MKTKGFTLVELSIVIVIIGLLVAGISAGKGLIDSAKLNAVVSDATKYQIAYNNFRGKYNAIPGDMATASGYFSNCAPGDNSKCNGNGDGVIQADSVACGSFSSSIHEGFVAWRHLYLGGFVQNAGKWEGLATLNSINDWARTDSGLFPEGRIPNSTYIMLGGPCMFYPDSFSEGANLFDPKNSITMIKSNGWGGLVIISAVEAFNIDNKNDDGLPNTGSYRSSNDSFDCYLNANCYCKTGNTYQLSGTESRACTISTALE